MKSVYDVWYRFGTPPWGRTASPRLVDLVESGQISPCRVIDIGCGTGATSIYLAARGFDVTGVDFAPAAIGRARRAAIGAGVRATFLVDDITSPTTIPGDFELLVDHGTFDDLSKTDRARYVSAMTGLAAGRATFYLWCFEWAPSRWERWLTRLIPIGNVNVEPGEVAAHFSSHWTVNQIDNSALDHTWPRRSATYLMTKRT